MIKISNRSLLENYIKTWNIDKVVPNIDIEDFEIHQFEKDEYIYTTGEKIKYFYFLVYGKAKVYITLKNGKSFLVRFYKPFEIMGDVEIMGEGNSHCNVESLQKTIVIGIQINKMQRYIDQDVEVAKYIGKSLSEKLRDRTDLNALDRLYPLENRFAAYLKGLLDLDINQTEIKIEKLKDISELLGSSYRHLARVISSMSEEGIIIKNKNKIIIKNMEELEQLSEHIYE